MSGTGAFPGETLSLGQTWNDLGEAATLTYPCRTSGVVCTATDRPAPQVAHQYTNGALTGIGGWASSDHHASGALATITRLQLVEAWAADPHGILALGCTGKPGVRGAAR